MRKVANGVVGVDEVTAVLSRLVQEEEDGGRVSRRMAVIDAFDTPKYKWSIGKKAFVPVPMPTGVHGTAEDRVDVFRERYNVILQRILRTDMFDPSGAAAGRREVFRLTTIDALIGSTGDSFLFGMLRAADDGGLVLEDPTKCVAIDVSMAQFTSGLITEGCFVIAQGRYVDEVFRARVLGFPPSEPRHLSRAIVGKADMFGGRIEDMSSEAMQRAEAADTEALIVFCSDVHLDSERVMVALRAIFEGYISSGTVPCLFVLMGNFTSRPLGHEAGAVSTLRAHFDALADLIAEFPALRDEADFIFVPGPHDPSPGLALPRPRLPDIFTGGFEARGIRATFSSSVVRVRYFTQEIVISRYDLLAEMRRSCLLEPSFEETTDVSEHLVKTVLDQGHLAPMPLYTTPVYWAFDHSLRLYPAPDVLVLADRYDQYEWRYEDTSAFNPGPFHISGAFMVYRPGTKTAEYSTIGPRLDEILLQRKLAKEQRETKGDVTKKKARGEPAKKAAAGGAPSARAGATTTSAPGRTRKPRFKDSEDLGPDVKTKAQPGKAKGKGKGRGGPMDLDGRQGVITFAPAPRRFEDDDDDGHRVVDLDSQNPSGGDDRQARTRRLVRHHSVSSSSGESEDGDSPDIEPAALSETERPANILDNFAMPTSSQRLHAVQDFESELLKPAQKRMRVLTDDDETEMAKGGSKGLEAMEQARRHAESLRKVDQSRQADESSSSEELWRKPL